MTDDLKERLSRLADRATEPGGDALEHLHQRRARKDRTRRVGTIALALIVAVAGSWGAFAAFAGRDDDRTAIGDESPSGVASWQPPEVLTVWPENPVRGPSPDDVQAAVDAGDESLAWRLDPKQVAERFAREFLAWNEVTVAQGWIDGWYSGVEPEAFSIVPCAPCGIDFKGAPLFVRLGQPASTGEGGIWSVVAVQSPELAIDITPGEPLDDFTVWTSLRLRLHLPEARRAHIGLVARNGCREISEFNPGLASGRYTIAVPEPEPTADADQACGSVGAGFVFAYAQDDTTVPVGDPLLEPAAIEYPWLTIIPLYVEMMRDDSAVAKQSPSPAPQPTTEPGPPLACPTAPTDVVEAVFREATLQACDRWFANNEIELHVVNHDVDVPIVPGLYLAGACDEQGCERVAQTIWRADRTLEGPAERTYRIPPLDPGSYVFVDLARPITTQIEIVVE